MDSNKKVIAFNTIYLYLGSFFQLLVGLYTSRALLQVLGVEDFGLYGVVGGVMTLLSFLNMAMSSASSRYLTYELAKGTLRTQKKVFSSIFFVHAAIALVTFLLAETVGLWYICNKLVVPNGRMWAAHWVYQTAVLSGIVNILQVPYNSSITAHEKMKFLSIWSSVNIFLKLVIILALFVITWDHLVVYSVFMFLTTLFIGVGFVVYCRRNFQECFIIWVRDHRLFREILAFALFNSFTSFSTVVRSQGTNLLLNRFFGVVMNAASGVATMVSGYLISFTTNIVTAFRPQIVKCYATQQYIEMQHNMEQCIKFCMSMYSLMAVPIFLEMDYVLHLWLGAVPAHAALFCKIGLVGSCFGILNMVMLIAVQATAYIKRNSLYISLASILSVIILYVVFRLKLAAYMAFVIFSLTELVICIISMLQVKVLIPLTRISGFLQCSLKVFLHILLGGIFAMTAHYYFAEGFLRLSAVTLLYVLLYSVMFYFFQIDTTTRITLRQKIMRH